MQNHNGRKMPYKVCIALAINGSNEQIERWISKVNAEKVENKFPKYSGLYIKCGDVI
ncbi:hypothetical protein [Lactobacillus helveticus]|uniref:hypothetical protein n=1 Tax=Lactobacillus helveticus TaxID=1587 RepID=UPI0015671D7D|nr:hypothetical protein [Lactobacillus helveticus]